MYFLPKPYNLATGPVRVQALFSKVERKFTSAATKTSRIQWKNQQMLWGRTSHRKTSCFRSFLHFLLFKRVGSVWVFTAATLFFSKKPSTAMSKGHIFLQLRSLYLLF